MDKYEAYDLARNIINAINSPTQLLCADYEYLCNQLKPVVEAYDILYAELQKLKKE